MHYAKRVKHTEICCDNEVCPVLPIGTHFLWHLLIGLVTYLAMRALILSTTTEVFARVR